MGAEQVTSPTPVVAGFLVGIGLAGAGWFAIGPGHVVYAVVVQGGFLFMALLIGPSLVDIARSRYRVRSFEPRIYTLLGAEAVRRALDVVGWNRVIKNMRQAKNEEPGTSGFLRGTEQSETGHLLGVAATGLLVLIATVTSHPAGALQILLIGVLLHVYPIMIQRLVRFRLTQRPTRSNYVER
ncbi:hypothetical protein [Arthrobacter sp. N1]|uniref:glycosyl-4,4'-diaponeurosporenoate acyltransferase CrtO family protein n=1 Tax=Arthrobacter sp. N1 TaxID=619291 RepID=UPI003BB15FC8